MNEKKCLCFLMSVLCKANNLVVFSETSKLLIILYDAVKKKIFLFNYMSKFNVTC